MGKRHRWIAEKETEYGTKPHRCMNCGIRKRWYGGDYQSWKYIWNTNDGINMYGDTVIGIKETWNRPDCGSVNVL